MPEAGAFSGKLALITGAGSGIGRAAALKLAGDGARILALGRTADELQHVAREIEAAGGAADVLVVDVSHKEQMREAFWALQDRAGSIDLVFANAGINGLWAPIDQLPPEEWEKTLAVNLTGTYLTIHHVVPLMKKNGGSIVVTASINGTRTFSNTGATAYAVSKAGQLAMVKMLAPELARYKIRINAVCPGAIDTKIDENTEKRGLENIRLPVEYPEGSVPITGGGSGLAEAVADLVVFLFSLRSRHITGTPIWIDGGQSLLV